MYLGRSRLWIASMFSRNSARASALSAAVDACGTGVATEAVAHAPSVRRSKTSAVRVISVIAVEAGVLSPSGPTRGWLCPGHRGEPRFRNRHSPPR